MGNSRLPLPCQGMFEPYLKSFYIRSTDPTQIKILKVSDRQQWVWPLGPRPRLHRPTQVSTVAPWAPACVWG